jgi:hypothetical protein
MGGPHGGDDRSAERVGVSRREVLLAGLAGLAGCNGFSRSRPRTDPSQTMTANTTQSDHGTVRQAAPGEVAATLDAAAAADGRTRVTLYPETTYRPGETWSVATDVVLDYRGATVEPRADVDVHDVQPGGRVEEPQVNLREIDGSFTSSVFRFDSRRHGFYGENDPWHVRGGYTRGRVGEGTLFEFLQGEENAIYFVHVSHSVRNIGTVVDMHRGDAWGINGCRFYGLWYRFQRGIHMHNRGTPSRMVDNISGNHFDVIAQPVDSELLWDLEAGHYNVLRGRLWDFSEYSDVMWRIHAEDAEKRYGNLLYWFPVGGTESHLQTDVGPTVFDDRLGDERNRVVVPWQQGSPVGEFTN